MSGGDEVRALKTVAARALKEAGIEDAPHEAALLVAHALGLDRAALLFDPARRATAAERARFDALLERRAAREPMAHLLGAVEFWSLRFAIGPGALIPRADSETVIEAALEAAPARDGRYRVLDLGTGSSCLLAAFLYERPAARGVGIERSASALAWAKRNVDALGLAGRAALLRGDWLEAVGEHARFDLVLANPPYVERAVIAGLAPEVRDHDPRSALDGGEDGLDAYRALLAPTLARLAPSGVALFEIGADQGAAVMALATRAGASVRLHRDLAGRARVVEARAAGR